LIRISGLPLYISIRAGDLHLLTFEASSSEVPDSKATGERRTQGMRNGLERWLHPILEHGTVPPVALALAMAPLNSRSLQRHDLTEPTNRGAAMLFSVRTTDTMTLAVRDYEPAVSSTKARPRTAALTVPTTGCIADHRQTN
jgi:hypothetical protein